MKKLFLLAAVVIPFTVGSAADSTKSVEAKADIQYMVSDDGKCAFRQWGSSITFLNTGNGTLMVDIFNYQNPPVLGGTGMGLFYNPIFQRRIISDLLFSLQFGGYLYTENAEETDDTYMMAAVVPEVNWGRFSALVFGLQFIPLEKRGRDQSTIFPAEAYFNICRDKIKLWKFEVWNVEIGLWSTFYDAEGVSSSAKYGPSVVFESRFGKTRIHRLERNQDLNPVTMVRHTFTRGF
ncbi:MAG: hypothetical protein KKC05_01345 [Nanoarchaeota archaeon]|nr:hypothetical protein [Nanoarchaeota archaeon]